MLTETQKTKLLEVQDSIQDQKLKSLLKGAIEGWDKSKYLPTRCDYGVFYRNYVLEESFGGMCLIGAAAYVKPVDQIKLFISKSKETLNSKEKFDIDFTETLELPSNREPFITSLFDGGLNSCFSKDRYKKEFPEWVEVILKIREIVIEND